MIFQQRWLSVVALLLFTLSSAQADVDKQRLRELIQLPAMSLSFNFSYTHNKGYYLETDEKPADPAEAIQVGLHNLAAGPERYYQIGNIYFGYQNNTAAKAAWEMSIGLFREQAKKEPNNGETQASLAMVLNQVQRKAERDAAMAEAIKRSPNNWNVWMDNAELKFGDALSALSGQMENIIHALDPTHFLSILNQKPSEAQVHTALNLLDQARDSYDKAVAVAPNNNRAYSDRWMYRAMYTTDVALLQQFLKAKMVTSEMEQIVGQGYPHHLVDADAVMDWMSVIRLSQKEPLALGMAAFMIASGELIDKPDSPGNTEGKAIDRLSPKSQKIVREQLQRLETLSNDKDQKLAGYSALALGALNMTVLSMSEAEAPLRRAYQLLPDDPQVADMLMMAKIRNKQWTEAETLLTEMLKRHESVRWRLILAKLRTKQQHWTEAEQDIRAVLKRNPDNFDANLALSALLLRAAKDDSMLTEAGKQLAKTGELFPQAPSADQSANFLYLRGIFYGLAGDMGEARRSLESLKDTAMADEAKEALALLPAK